MLLFHKLAATVFGIGYVGKGGGTVAAIFACICWYFLFPTGFQALPAIILTLVVTFLGIWNGNVVEPYWGKDHARVVIDEVAGQFITLLFIPVSIKYLIVGLILFRFFDIVKPLYIRKAEALPGGWGVMFDDVLAGVYANVTFQVLLWSNLL